MKAQGEVGMAKEEVSRCAAASGAGITDGVEQGVQGYQSAPDRTVKRNNVLSEALHNLTCLRDERPRQKVCQSGPRYRCSTIFPPSAHTIVVEAIGPSEKRIKMDLRNSTMSDGIRWHRRAARAAVCFISLGTSAGSPPDASCPSWELKKIAEGSASSGHNHHRPSADTATG